MLFGLRVFFERGVLGGFVGVGCVASMGAFSFEKIESLQLFRIDVVNADGTERGSERVKSPADDQIKTLLIQRDGLVVPVVDGALLPADDAGCTDGNGTLDRELTAHRQVEGSLGVRRQL